METNEEHKSEVETADVVKGRLTWVDLVFVIIGIILLYVVVNLLTFVVARFWPYEMVLIYFNGILTQGFFVILLISLKKVRRWNWNAIGWRKYNGKVWLSVLGIYGLTMLFNLLYGVFLFTHGINPPDSDVYSKLLSQTTLLTYLLNILITVGLAPIIEETVFRGLIYGSLKSYFGPWTAAGLSALLFSGLHLQLYGLIPRFALGLALAYLYEKNKSLYPAIMMHALNNFVAVTLGTFAT